MTLLLKMPFKIANFMMLSVGHMYTGGVKGLENQLLVTTGFSFPSQIRNSTSKLKRQSRLKINTWRYVFSVYSLFSHFSVPYSLIYSILLHIFVTWRNNMDCSYRFFFGSAI